MPYSKLREKIAGRFKSMQSFAKSVGISSASLSLRLNGKRQWKGNEIVAVCQVLDIPLEEAHLYFFS